MKKIILGIFSCLTILLSITGCGNKSTQSDVEQYLKKYYSNESFKIVSEEKIDNIKGNCNTDKSGHKYTIVSNDTNIEFIIEDIYEASNYGTCNYNLSDDYYQVALEKYIIEFKDSRISLDTHMLKSDIKIDYKDFKSIDEISNVLYNFKTYYESKKPFMEKAEVDVFIYNSGSYLGFITLSYNNKEITTNSINKEISNLL